MCTPTHQGLRFDHLTTPGGWIHICDGLGERPAMPSEIQSRVLSLSIRIVRWRAESPRSHCSGPCVMGIDIRDANHDSARTGAGRRGLLNGDDRATFQPRRIRASRRGLQKPRAVSVP